MPVQRFRTLEEWNKATVLKRQPRGFERFVRHNAFLRTLSRRSYPRGVYKYRDIEEAQRARDALVVSSSRK